MFPRWLALPLASAAFGLASEEALSVGRTGAAGFSSRPAGKAPAFELTSWMRSAIRLPCFGGEEPRLPGEGFLPLDSGAAAPLFEREGSGADWSEPPPALGPADLAARTEGGRADPLSPGAEAAATLTTGGEAVGRSGGGLGLRAGLTSSAPPVLGSAPGSGEPPSAAPSESACSSSFCSRSSSRSRSLVAACLEEAPRSSRPLFLLPKLAERSVANGFRDGRGEVGGEPPGGTTFSYLYEKAPAVHK